MKITRIRAYRVELPLREGRYNWSGGKSVSVFDSTVVVVDTDEGLVGYGEVCPLGRFYLPAYAAGARDQPVCVLMGGRYGESVGLYRAISQEAPEAMA